MLKRDLSRELEAWQARPDRKPILLRGARQVGKTHLIESLSKMFDHTVLLNFELDPQFIPCFEELNPAKLIPILSALSGQSIEEGKTLLFLDEIQQCPRAIQALRYFKERRPHLHVLAAGSLVEFALHREAIHMPVGRVDYLYVQPCSFREYLDNSGHQSLRAFLDNVTLEGGIPDPIHHTALSLLHEYKTIGGMPEAMAYYLAKKEPLMVERIQNSILNTYQDDFGKYASQSEQSHLQLVFEKVSGYVGQQLIYSKLAPDHRSREIKQALSLLEYAGIIKSCYGTAAAGLPLSATLQEKKRKLLFLDIGLMQRKSQLPLSLLLSDTLTQLNGGALAEQLVGQELLAYSDPYTAPQLHFWARDQKGSQAEVDYLLPIDGHIIPIEVKSSATGHLKSLSLLMQERNLPLGVKVSTAPLSISHQVLNLPIYLLWRLPSLIRSLL